MSLLKLGGIQIGQSNTASNNFHWRNLLDGLLRLSRGNAGSPITDVMRVRADNSVEFPGGVSDGVLGAGQTWQNVTASRVLGTNYTNSTGKPIMVTVYTSQSAGLTDIIVDGIIAARASAATGSEGVNAAAIIPPGGVYSVSASNPLSYWAELR